MKNAAVAKVQEWEAVARRGAVTGAGACARALPRTRLRCAAEPGVGGTFSSRTSTNRQLPCKTSGWAAVYGLGSGSIREKIIGRGMRAVVAGFAVGEKIHPSRRAFPLLQKQSREHGGGVFFHPLIKQGANLLAEIGGTCQTREFKALQGTPRSGKQELPRWLGHSGGHRPPIGDASNISM